MLINLSVKALDLIPCRRLLISLNTIYVKCMYENTKNNKFGNDTCFITGKNNGITHIRFKH